VTGLAALLALVRSNRNFRLLWFGQIVSQLGDWFNVVALYALLFELTGSATAVAGMMVMQLLPVALVGPVSGVVVDRFDRRRIMIAADLLRGAAVLGLLMVRSPDAAWLAYVVTGVMVACSGFFEPARSATVPSIVARDQLIAANAISTGTWSAMLAIGASLGGGVTVLLGRDVPARDAAVKAALGLRGVIDGLSYIRRRRDVARIALIKGGWALVGGALLLLTVFGDRIFRIGDSSDAGIGILFAARGIGAFAGSLMVSLIAARQGDLIRLIAPAYFIAGACYAALAIVPTIWLAAAAVVAAHIFGSILWVSSNVLLQIKVPDEFRGRVFAAELIVMALVQSAVAYTTAVALDRGQADPRVLAAVVGFALWIPAALWLVSANRQTPTP
jgi:hypothetical protein